MRREDLVAAIRSAMRAEIQQEANREAGRLEVVQDLGLVAWSEFGQGFQFDNDRFEAEEVRLVEGFKLLPSVNDGNFLLPSRRDTAQTQLDFHCMLIDRLQETMPELIINLHRRADDRGGCGSRWLSIAAAPLQTALDQKNTFIRRWWHMDADQSRPYRVQARQAPKVSSES